jgi:ABC-type transport system involved in multi-copper enzyme maturation permease subunit
MNAFLAIIQDTWRQSIHQWVLIVLIGLMGIMAVFAVSTAHVRTAPDGTEFFTVRWERDTLQRGMDVNWEGEYADALKDEVRFYERMRERQKVLNRLLDEWEKLDYQIKTLEANDPDNAELPALRDKRRAFEYERDRVSRENLDMNREMRLQTNRMVEERTADMPRLNKGVEFWLTGFATAIYLLSMIGFIAACAIYIPNMLEHGSVDLVLSQPIRRWQIYFGKYIGGLLLYSAALVVTYIIIFIGVGAVSGVWHWPFFAALPVTIFSLALLYSIIAWVGLWTRSTAMAMVVGYVYYLVVDTAVGYLHQLPFVDEFPAIDKLADILKFTFPSFVWLRESASAAVLSVAVIPWQHLIVGTVWLIICLATSYNRFRINDY